MPLNSHSPSHWIMVPLMLGCFAAGWGLSQLSPQFARDLMDRVLGAHEVMYHARVGYPGEAMQFFVYGDGFSSLQAMVETDPDLLAFDTTLLPGLASVTLVSAQRDLLARVKAIDGVSRVIRIPYFCH